MCCALLRCRKEKALDGLRRERTDACLAKVRDPGLSGGGRGGAPGSHARRAVGRGCCADGPRGRRGRGAAAGADARARAWRSRLLIEHAQWALDNEQDDRPRAAARRFARSGIDLITDIDPEDSELLVAL